MRKLTIKLSNTKKTFTIKADGEVLIQCTNHKIEGFRSILDLLIEEKISPDEFMELLDKIADHSRINTVKDNGTDESSGLMFFEMLFGGFDELGQTVRAYKKFQRFGKLLTLCKDVTTYPAVIKCPDCLEHPHATIMIMKPEAKKIEDSYSLQVGHTGEFETLEHGLEYVEAVKQEMQLDDPTVERLKKEVEALEFKSEPVAATVE